MPKGSSTLSFFGTEAKNLRPTPYHPWDRFVFNAIVQFAQKQREIFYTVI